MYGDKEEKQNAVPDVILSDVHEKTGETYVPYNDFGSPYITNKKELTSTSANNESMHITPEKKMVSDTILSNDIYLTQCDGNTPSEQYHSQQNCQRDNSNGNTPSEPSDHKSDDDNFDDQIPVSSYER